MLQIKNLTKVYRTGDTKVFALNKVYLTIEQGEFVAIMGSQVSESPRCFTWWQGWMPLIPAV